MTKNIFYAFAVTALFAFASCSDDSNIVPDNQDENVSLSVNVTTDDFLSRSRYGEGTLAKWFRYLIFEKTGDTEWQFVLEDDHITNFTGSTVLDLKLLKDRTYTIVMVASSLNAPYKLSHTNDYAGLITNTAYEDPYKENMDNWDLFYATQTVTAAADQQLNVTLTRPLAQINIGTDDYEAAENMGITPVVSKIKLTGAAMNFDLLREQGLSIQDVQLPFTPIDRTQTYPVGDGKYEYLAVGYFFPDQATADVEVTYRTVAGDATTETVRTIKNVPVKANFKTNIYGSILTGSLNADVDAEMGL